MSFLWSPLLYLLLLLPLLILIHGRIQRRRRETAARLGMGWMGEAGAPPRRNLPAYLFFGGIFILLLSLARPVALTRLPRIEGTVILTFDVSGSMSAEDLQPTRMEAAKGAAKTFVENQPSSVLIGIVAFSDGGISVLAPTDDRGETLAAIERLVPRRGTSLANGILVSLNTIVVSAGDPPFLTTVGSGDSSQPELALTVQGWYPSSAIVLLTDGENTQSPPDPVAAADLAADLGIRIYTVGVGSPEGAVITVEGYTVLSQLNEPLLQSIAATTGGGYYRAGNEDELQRIYNDLEPRLSIHTEEMEVTALFAGLGMLVLLCGGAVSMLWFGRVP